jgi:hypothetical protein
MIIKTNKAGKELESWPTIEEAAKAIKLAPAVLKKHLKGKPPKLNGFIFKFKDEVPETDSNAETNENSLTFTQITGDNLDESTGNRRFWKAGDTEAMPVINYVTLTPEVFDNPKLPFVLDEMGQLPTLEVHHFKAKDVPNDAIMLDEFGEPVGQPTIPPELSENEITENDLLEIQMNARLHRKGQPEPVIVVDMEEVADLLRTPLERRLHNLKK